MPAIDDVLAFSRSRSLWQQDLIRRIHTQTSVSSADILETLAFLKEEHGLIGLAASGDDDAPLPQPLSPVASSSSAADSASSQATILVAVRDAQNANRLAAKQYLPFAKKGITLIFGFNGSGKSGYGRILKRACRSRQDKQNRMHGDVYSALSSPPASAIIEFAEGPDAQTFSWRDGLPSSDSLARISVFDSETAPLYANQQNKIEFLPYGLDVLPRLSNACEELQRRLDEEIASISAMVGVQPHTFTSKTYQDLMDRLSPETAESLLLSNTEIEMAAAWDEAWEDSVARTEGEIRDLSEPAAKSAKLRRLQTSLDSVSERLTFSLSPLSDDSLLTYRSAFVVALDAERNAKAATEGRFTEEKFGEAISSSAWRKLYSAAREFSALVYSGKSFPVVEDDSFCVLCQQPLSGDARNRFMRFQAFVEDMSQRRADDTAVALQAHITLVEAIQIPAENVIRQSLAEYVAESADGEELLASATACLDKLNAAKMAALALLGGTIHDKKFSSDVRAEINKLQAASSCLQDQIKQLDAATNNVAKLALLKAKHAELLDRKTWGSFKVILLEQRVNLAHIASLRKCRAACETRSISTKSSSLREKYLTTDFAEMIDKEVRKLGLDYLPVKVEGRTDRGASMIGVTLDKLAKVSTADILSEGEFRGLALACFMAEISMISGCAGIIVDDPVSSLDHVHSTQIARRLVEEAVNGRQVIIFTHDLPFYSAVLSLAVEMNVPLHPNWIQQSNGEFGVVSSEDSPWEAKKLNQRIDLLSRNLAAIPDPKSISVEEFMKLVKSFYASLRETWERLVEERLLADVVGRFQMEVKTQSLKTVHVTNEDFTRVHFGMAKASKFSGHDRARGMQAATPTIAEMSTDLENIRSYDKDLRERSKTLESERKKLLQPIPADVVSRQANNV